MSDEKVITCPNCLTKHFSEFDIKTNDNRTFKGNCSNCKKDLKFKINNGLVDRNSISFSINGINYTVDNQYPVTMTLNDYLRNILKLTGTKIMCRQGGCGSCIVTAEVNDYTTGETKFYSINSCIYPLYLCDKLKITTVEGVGNKSKGFNEIQKRLAENNGTQCGFCTPGFVMNMYSLLQNDPKPSKAKIENSFDGNICRCTGFRSILDSMKSFASDANPIDLEELHKLKCINKGTIQCNQDKKVHIIKDDVEWYSANNMDSLYALLTQYQQSNYRLVAANTIVGIYPEENNASVYISIKDISDMYQVIKTNSTLTIGSLITVTKLIEFFDIFSKFEGYQYLSEISNHMQKVGNVSIRNIATWGGNLIMKYNHLSSSSDIFVCLEAINASIRLVGPSKSTPAVDVTPLALLKTPIKGKVIFSMTLKPFDMKSTIIKSYKVMPRSQNSRAYVNSAFNFQIDPDTLIVKNCSMVFGGLSPDFVHANQTEKYWLNKSLSDQKSIDESFQILKTELKVDEIPGFASTDYRRSLALSLFYKFLLFVNKKRLTPRLQSAFETLIELRPISSGIQNTPKPDPTIDPVSKPMAKLNALLQTSGEAVYAFDKSLSQAQLHGAFILSDIANCKLDKIDTSGAINMPGVVKILLAKDIPGTNSCMPAEFYPEKLFCDDSIDYAGQSIGLVVAETFEQALSAAKNVKITYKEIKTPILSIADAIKNNSFHDNPPIRDFVFGNAEQAIESSPLKISNDFSMGSQYHFHMEHHVASCEPYENYYNINCSTQNIDIIQQGVTEILNLPSKSFVNVKVDQLGGGFGGKLSRANFTACAAAVASFHLSKTVRVALNLNTASELIGKRDPWYVNYQVGFDNTGKINGIILSWYSDAGNSPKDNSIRFAFSMVDNVYNIKNWHVKARIAKTNLPTNTYVRSPTTLNAIAVMENIIENVAIALDADPVEIRKVNLYKKGDTTPTGEVLSDFNVDILMDNLIQSSDYKNRLSQINLFNLNNRWKKKGLSLTCINWGAFWSFLNYNCMISIFGSDGSVQLTHGGIECGQGIHTVAIQVLAYSLKIPMEIISVKHAESFMNANGADTGGSTTTELVCLAIIECCKFINQKLDPIRQTMQPDYTWKQLIRKARSMGVDLTTRYYLAPPQNGYKCYGVACSESLVDILTGESQISRIDILYDAGTNLNPEINIGQAEGAFVMGMGFWLFEDIKYDPVTGKNLSRGTWEYKVPSTKDIPIDFRISLLSNNPNPAGVLGSKAIGEPPLCLSPCTFFSIRNAIQSALKDIGKKDFVKLDSPLTVEQIQKACLIDTNQFKISD